MWLPVCGIHPGYVNSGVVYYILIVDRTNYTIHIVYNLLHVFLDDNILLYGPQIVMYYLELGQMVSISKYHDTIRYRYQTFNVSKYRVSTG